MGLREYQRKRDFRKTSEPKGARGRAALKKGAPRFVVQKHDATRLHYDFRLEHDGTLKSWAVPKGPSLDPKERRLAVEVEDHPLDYGGFEGTIPQGEYGGGTVLLWDRGTWHPEEDPATGLRAGRLKFWLQGEKLRGGWTLVRMADKPGKSAGKPNWLLIKEKDEEARARAAHDILDERPESVKSGRDLPAIAAGERPRRKVVHAATKSEPAAKPARAARKAAPAPSAGAVRRPARRVLPVPAAEPVEAGETMLAGVRLSNPGRVLWPEQGLTKLDLATYYQRITDWILPHVAHRPLTLVRCPQGRGKHCFFQKHIKESAPGLFPVDILEDSGATVPYIQLEDLTGLIALVQMGTLEIHGWGSRVEDVERPDRLVFDLDPDAAVPWPQVVAAARLVRARLEDLELRSFVQTTGGKGLHVVVPLARRQSWEEAKPFARAFAVSIEREAPEQFLTKASKAARTGKIFLDWLRNGRGATAILAYSSRAREGAPVATPVAWEELDSVQPAAFTVTSVPGRLAKLRKDPWAEFWTVRQSLRQEIRKKLGAL